MMEEFKRPPESRCRGADAMSAADDPGPEAEGTLPGE